MTQEQYGLFKSYDIRGEYPTINGTLAYWIGYALVKEILEKENLPLKVAVLHDHRMSSPELYKSVVHGIQDAGGEALPLGLGSTDMMYGACQLFNTAGVMITASHNPAKDNGIKIVKKVPQAIGIGSGLEKIRDVDYLQTLKDIDVSTLSEIHNDETKKQELITFYTNKIIEVGDVENIRIQLKEKKLKVAVDTGNGMGGWLMENVIAKIYPEIEFIPLFWELDGTYPNHQADPLVDANIQDLRKAVLEHHADFGMAFDGDCDRVFFIDEKTDRVTGDFVVAIFGQYFLRKYHAGVASLQGFAPAIVYNKPASRCTDDLTLAEHGQPYASKQGHNHMKAKLAEVNGLYGGEHSGHHYFGQYAFMDGGAFAVASFINMVVTQTILVSEMTADLKKKYLLSGETNFKLAEIMDANERLKIIDEKLKKQYPDAEYDYLDGVSVVYPDWKFNIRLSNTEPLLRLNLEVVNNDGTKSRNDVDQKMTEVKGILGL